MLVGLASGYLQKEFGVIEHSKWEHQLGRGHKDTVKKKKKKILQNFQVTGFDTVNQCHHKVKELQNSQGLGGKMVGGLWVNIFRKKKPFD